MEQMDGRDLLIRELKQDIANLEEKMKKYDEERSLQEQTLKQMAAERDDAVYRLDETRKSFSYRLGLALTALPRKFRRK